MTYLELTPRFVIGDLDLTQAPFAVNQEGINYETGDLVTSVLSSFILDGDLEISQRRGNMTLSIPVLIEGSNLLELAQALQRLTLQSEKDTNTLTIDPGDGIAPVTVFNTFKGDPTYTYNAEAEQQGWRQYMLTMRALPFGRSADQVVAPGLPPATTPTTVSVNDASSGAGWSAAGGITASGGTVRATASPSSSGAGTDYLTMLLAQSFDSTGTPYVFVDWRTISGYVGGSPQMSVDGVESANLASAPSPTSGYIRTWFRVTPGPHTSLAFIVPINNDVTTVAIDQVSRTNVPPASGTPKQKTLTVQVEGSARTQGSIEVFSESDILGDVLVYTHRDTPDSYSPALSSYRTGGSPTPDSTAVSGSSTDLGIALALDVPVASLLPGLYTIMVRMAAPSSAARSVRLTTQTRVAANNVGRQRLTTAAVAGTAWQIVPIGNFDLPSSGFRDGSIGIQRFILEDVAGGASVVKVDEVWAFNMTLGRLTQVKCGIDSASGYGTRRLWIDSATVASRTPSVFKGNFADGSDAYFDTDDIKALGRHEFIPSATKVLAVTTNVNDAQVALKHFPRWLGHAAS